MIEVLPAETRGSGSPVGGILPVTTRAFISDCIPITQAIPTESKNPKKSLLLSPIFTHFTTIVTIKTKRKISPTNPISSPITAKIKSLSEKGKNLNFCRELKSPTPNQPPEPNAYKDYNN